MYDAADAAYRSRAERIIAYVLEEALHHDPGLFLDADVPESIREAERFLRAQEIDDWPWQEELGDAR